MKKLTNKNKRTLIVTATALVVVAVAVVLAARLLPTVAANGTASSEPTGSASSPSSARVVVSVPDIVPLPPIGGTATNSNAAAASDAPAFEPGGPDVSTKPYRNRGAGVRTPAALRAARGRQGQDQAPGVREQAGGKARCKQAKRRKTG